MKVINFIAGLLIGIGLTMLHTSAAASKPEIRTVVDTKYVTEYIPINKTEPMNVIVTAYTSGPESTGKHPGMKDYGITFTGTKARSGVCAVDPNYIPLGSSLYVESYGYCHAEDTGSKIVGSHIDVWMEHVSDALKFSRQTRKVWFLKDFSEE